MNIAAVKPIDFNAKPENPVRRFGRADIQTKGTWLIERLRLRYPGLHDIKLMGWIQGILDSNECLAIQNDHAVALAQISHEDLSVKISVKERFVLCQNPDDPKHVDEAGVLYLSMMKWAEDVGATDVLVGVFSDVSRDKIKEITGRRIFMLEQWFAKVGK